MTHQAFVLCRFCAVCSIARDAEGCGPTRRPSRFPHYFVADWPASQSGKACEPNVLDQEPTPSHIVHSTSALVVLRPNCPPGTNQGNFE